MGLILKKAFNDSNIKLDSNIIIGIMGDYTNFIKRLDEKNVFKLTFTQEEGKVKDVLKRHYHLDQPEKYEEILNIVTQELAFDANKLDYDIKDLSDSDQRICQYIIMFMENKHFMLIDEPLIYLDYANKKKIISLLKRIIYQTGKTIFICSNDSNVIYSLAKKVLLINQDGYDYDVKEKILINDATLQKYGIIKPQIVEFVDEVKAKGIDLGYLDDIRDLMKDVYRNV